MDELIELGEIVEDKVTGYEGTVTARAEYLSGTPRYQVSSIQDGKIHEEWIDGGRVTVLGK